MKCFCHLCTILFTVLVFSEQLKTSPETNGESQKTGLHSQHSIKFATGDNPDLFVCCTARSHQCSIVSYGNDSLWWHKTSDIRSAYVLLSMDTIAEGPPAQDSYCICRASKYLLLLVFFILPNNCSVYQPEHRARTRNSSVKI